MFNKLIKYYLIAVMTLMVVLSSSEAFAQVSAGGITTRASSQLVFWYDEFSRDTEITITNTNLTDAVEIHVQIFQTPDIDPDGDGITNVRCEEADFNDVLTQRDTHTYDLDDIILNFASDNNPAQDEIPAIISEVDDTKGFVVITPVIGDGDNTAKSWQFMIGHSTVQDGSELWRVAASGRDAVDLATGAVLPQDTVLDGSATGFLLIQPDEVVFNVADTSVGISSVDIAAISFFDVFNNNGDLDSYDVQPGATIWDSTLFNFFEQPGSCPIRLNNCFNNWGLNEDNFDQDNDDIDEDVFLCPAVTLLPQNDNTGYVSGWTRSIVTGVDETENQLAVVHYTNGSAAGADWANVVGEPIPVDPPPAEVCSVEGDEDGVGGADCADPACDGEMGPNGEICENVAEMTCDDTFDNDADGATDCADSDCDLAAGCEGSGEGDCTDGEDTDGDGATDCEDGGCAADPACAAPGDDDDDDDDDNGGGSGCSVVSNASAGTSAVSFLLPMMVFGLGIMFRRLRRK